MLRKLLATMRQAKYQVYTEPFRLNIVGVRADSTKPNSFDDTIHVFYRDARHKWQYHSWPATTDPGTYWLRSPLHPQGTALLCQQQAVDAYAIDFHRGKYRALCQRHRPVCVVRDYDRDNILDFQNGERMTGMFGINIHRAASNGTTKEVQRYSAGCQVFANADDFDHFIQLCDTHRNLYDNYFTYTLLDERAVARANRKKWMLRTSILTGLGSGAYLLWGFLKNQFPEF